MRILLADDHRLMIEGVSNLLAAYGMEVLGIASDGAQAVEMAEALRPDLILMDVRMPVQDGLWATRQIKARHPEIKIIMLTTSADEQDLFEAIKSGASGYLLKSINGDAFIEALHGLEGGVPPFSPGLAASLLREFARLGRLGDASGQSRVKARLEDCLTERQAEVLRLVADGMTYKEIGSQLALSERTVRYHMVEIMAKLHLHNRSQVLAYVGKEGKKS